MTTTTKKVLTVKVLDDAKLEKFLKLEKEISNKKKALKLLTKEITEALESGAVTHPDSVYMAQLEDKKAKFTPAYMGILKEEVGLVKFDELVAKAKKAFEKAQKVFKKAVENGTEKAKKDLVINLK